MAQQETQLAPDLERSADLPVGVQLAWRLQALIRSGGLRAGDRLPGVRELASGTGVNVNTARAVYRRLEEEGLIASRHGLGTFVADRVEATPELEHLAADAAGAAREAGVDPRDLARAIYAGSATDFAGPLPVPAAEPTAEELERLVKTEGDRNGGAAARRELRRQIARLETQLAPYPEASRPEEAIHPLLRPKAHVADVGELEAIRDTLMKRLKAARTAAEKRGRGQRRARERLDDMVRDPAAHRWESVSNKELGEPGCTTFEVGPKWGPVGALMNWWRVRVSGGCPLAEPPEAAG